MLQIKSIISSSSEDSADAAPEHHLLAYHEGRLVHSVSAQGDALFAGSLRVLNASLTVEPSLISGHNLRLQNNLHVEGSANVEESLTIGAGFALTPGGMTVDVATHTGTLFELKSRQQGFNGTLMELNSVGDSNVLIRTVSSGLTTFELHSSGDVRMNGLRLASGGVNVQAGGIEVSAYLLYRVYLLVVDLTRCCVGASVRWKLGACRCRADSPCSLEALPWTVSPSCWAACAPRALARTWWSRCCPRR